MLNFRTYVLLVVFAASATYLVELASFAIAHSAALLILATLAAPGLYVGAFRLVPGGWPTILLSCAVNAAYYYFIALWLRNRRRAAK